MKTFPHRNRPTGRTLLPALLLAATMAGPTRAADPPAPPTGRPFAAAPSSPAPAWVGEYRWRMTMPDHRGDPFRLRLGFTALPNGLWAVTGVLVLDDAELGATGSARLEQGRLVVDLMTNAAVRDIVPDAEKRALFPAGQVPAKLSSAGLAAMRISVDPQALDGVASLYMTYVVSGNRVQGPVYGESRLVPDAGPAAKTE